MRPHGPGVVRIIGVGWAGLLAASVAHAQAPRTYGPGLTFGQYGAMTSYPEAFGNPYGGIGAGYGYGYGLGYGGWPKFAPAGPMNYIPPYLAPGLGANAPAGAAPFGVFYQNPATFPPGSPNDPTVGRVVAPTPTPSRARAPRRPWWRR